MARRAPLAALRRRETPTRSSGPTPPNRETRQFHSADELLDLASDCVFAVDCNWRFSYLNDQARDEIADGRDLLGLTLWGQFPKLVGTDVERRYREAMRSRRPDRFDVYYDPLETWYEISVSPLASGGIAVWFRDINARMRDKEELRRAEERYRLAASGAADLVLDWNLETGEIVWREALQHEPGLGEGVPKTHDWCISQIHPDDRERVSAEIQRCLESGTRHEWGCRLKRSDGCYADVRQAGVVQRDAAGKPLRMIVAMRDVTEQHRAVEAVQRREAKLSNIFSQALVGILESGSDRRARLINGRFCDILGRSEDQIIGRDVMDFTHPADLDWNRPLLREHSAKGEPFQIVKRYLRPDGSTVWCRVSVSFVLSAGGEIESSIVVAEDITQQQLTAEQLKWASEHDALTGLPNRRVFEARLQAATIRAMQNGGKVGLLLLDLDHFKHVNDSFGHPAGDVLLQEIGARLTGSVRSNDLVARLGGDEFAILVESAEGELDLPRLGEAVLQRLKRPVALGHRSMEACASIGGAEFPADADNAHELFKHADIALYALKDSGRGGTCMFNHTMLEEALVVASQLALARSAAFDSSVEPHYQPKVDLSTGRIVGFEALLRWHHGIRGLQSPDTVAEAFRDYELASKIGGLVQARVLADLRGWLREDLPVGRIAINAAPAEFLRDDFAERLLQRLHEHDIAPSLIEVEVTEHVFLERGSGFVGRALSTLHDAGVRIALDDFGTGYSSLSHVRDFPVDVVKIDKSFIDNVARDTESSAIVSAVVALARGLDVAVVAEGIETEKQRRVLQELGCPLGQGYYFGRPVGAGQVPAAVSNRSRTGRKAA